MFPAFNLTLVVNHACNLRCKYCYTGLKYQRAMPLEVGCRSIDRAIASLADTGTLELDFFGGEPLLESRSIAEWISYARRQSKAVGVQLRIGITTNGTICDDAAWAIMVDPEVVLHISCDGLPAAHDQNRVDTRGLGTSQLVVDTIKQLAVEREVCIVMVVGPSNVQQFPAGLAFLHDLGVSHVTPSLDVWSRWSAGEAQMLDKAIGQAAEVWAKLQPGFSVSWFDEKAATLIGSPSETTTGRCGFGQGQVAVAPSGNLYPCERLVGEDSHDNGMRLAGTAMDGDDFLHLETPDGPVHDDCSGCALQTQCSTACRCSNYIRTGDVRRPDGLLCLFDQACLRETKRVLEQMAALNEVTIP